jgi:hypothetical protein
MNEGLAGDPDFWSASWLTAINGDLDPAEIRAYWNVKETPILTAILPSAPKIKLGLVYAYAPDGFDKGPARRLSDLLFVRGTDEYVLPTVDDALIVEMLAAYAPRPGDRMPSASTVEELDRFLNRHRGSKLVEHGDL